MAAAGRLAVAVSALATGAMAQTAPEPPVWALLAECGAVFEAAAAARDSYAGASLPDLARAEEAAARFVARAERAAEEAGQADPAGDVTSILVYLRPRWQNRLPRLWSTQSNLDWIAYCGRLGRAEGVLPLLPG